MRTAFEPVVVGVLNVLAALPQRRLFVLIPRQPAGLHRLHFLRVACGLIILLPEIVLQVIQLQLLLSND